jgi:PAS domain S-box-containing protein
MSRSLPVVRRFGIGLGVALAAAMAIVLAVDHSVHVADVGHDGLGPWLVTVGAGLLVLACYWAGLCFLLKRLRELSGAEHQFEAMFERNPLPAWVFDTETLRFLAVNRAAVEEYGYTREEFRAMTILDLRPPQQRGDVVAEVAGPPRPDYADAKVWEHHRKDGSAMDVQVHAASIDFQGCKARLVVAENVTDRLAADRELAWHATHRMSTGLPNAIALAETVRAWHGPSRIACAQVRGLDLVEDSLGPGARASALQALAARLSELGRHHGAVGHQRDTDFSLAIADPARWAEAVAELRDALLQPIESDDGVHQLEAWIGTADLPGDADDPAQALPLARIAARVARAEGVPVLAYQPAMSQEAGRRLAMVARIRHAIRHDEFALAFQPIQRMGGDRAVVGLEALLRWPQPDGSFVPPLEFIPLCEDTGLIVPLGRWVLRRAAMAARQLADAGFGMLSVAVNVSHAQIATGDFAADVAHLFGEFGLERGALHIELTESVLMGRAEHTLDVLRRLHDHGICISLDDFGTGFSNMAYLQQLPIDALKIDRSFVSDVENDERNAFICRALIALGHGLGLQVVAEGIETPRQYDWLRRHGCDQAQGYALGRPESLERTLALLRGAPGADAAKR